MVQEYWKKQIGPKAYRVNLFMDGEEIEFDVHVANDESELDDLVQFTIDQRNAPPPSYE